MFNKLIWICNLNNINIETEFLSLKVYSHYFVQIVKQTNFLKYQGNKFYKLLENDIQCILSNSLTCAMKIVCNKRVYSKNKPVFMQNIIKIYKSKIKIICNTFSPLFPILVNIMRVQWKEFNPSKIIFVILHIWHDINLSL